MKITAEPFLNHQHSINQNLIQTKFSNADLKRSMAKLYHPKFSSLIHIHEPSQALVSIVILLFIEIILSASCV